MKTKKSLIKIITIMLIILAIKSSYAAGISKDVSISNSAIDQFRKQVTQKIIYPLFAKEKQLQGEVKIIFEIDKTGRIIVDSAISEDFYLANYVKNNFSSFQFANSNLEKDKTYRITIKFKLL